MYNALLGGNMGRPRKYTDEQRKELNRQRVKDRYYKKKGYKQGERPLKERRDRHPSYNMFINAKKRAKELVLPFNLDLEDILIPTVCPLLGITIEKGVGTYTDNSPTLDRIFPHLGYVKGNVWVVSMRANRIKQDASLEELFILCKNLMNKLTTI